MAPAAQNALGRQPVKALRPATDRRAAGFAGAAAEAAERGMARATIG
jgi:NaMN:DMB phosphoribosyltransferase